MNWKLLLFFQLFHENFQAPFAGEILETQTTQEIKSLCSRPCPNCSNTRLKIFMKIVKIFTFFFIFFMKIFKQAPWAWKNLETSTTQTFHLLCSWSCPGNLRGWGLKNFHENLENFQLSNFFMKIFKLEKRKVCVVGLVHIFQAQGAWVTIFGSLFSLGVSGR